jgi:hypothetical protein
MAENRKPFRFDRHARADLRQGVFWYEERRVGLGARFAADVRAAIDRIVAAPERWPIRRGLAGMCFAASPTQSRTA